MMTLMMMMMVVVVIIPVKRTVVGKICDLLAIAQNLKSAIDICDILAVTRKVDAKWIWKSASLARVENLRPVVRGQSGVSVQVGPVSRSIKING